MTPCSTSTWLYNYTNAINSISEADITKWWMRIHVSKMVVPNNHFRYMYSHSSFCNVRFTYTINRINKVVVSSSPFRIIIRYSYYAIRLHAIPGQVDRRPSQPANGISASHTNPHKMLLHWMHSPDTLRIYTNVLFSWWYRTLDGTGQVRDSARYVDGTHTHKNIVASCLCWYGTVRDRYGIAPGVTQTNKQTNTKRESLEAQGPTLCFFACSSCMWRAKAVWTLASAKGYWSSVCCTTTPLIFFVYF